jgi:hypothetical protein
MSKDTPERIWLARHKPEGDFKGLLTWVQNEESLPRYDDVTEYIRADTIKELTDQVAELLLEVAAKDKQFRSCCEHGGNCADPPPDYCPQCVNRSKSALAMQESIVKDLTEQCRSFHGQVAELQADKQAAGLAGAISKRR